MLLVNIFWAFNGDILLVITNWTPYLAIILLPNSKSGSHWRAWEAERPRGRARDPRARAMVVPKIPLRRSFCSRPCIAASRVSVSSFSCILLLIFDRVYLSRRNRELFSFLLLPKCPFFGCLPAGHGSFSVFSDFHLCFQFMDELGCRSSKYFPVFVLYDSTFMKRPQSLWTSASISPKKTMHWGLCTLKQCQKVLIKVKSIIYKQEFSMKCLVGKGFSQTCTHFSTWVAWWTRQHNVFDGIKLLNEAPHSWNKSEPSWIQMRKENILW